MRMQQYLRRFRHHLLMALFILSLLLLFLWPRVAITVPPGYTAVLYSRLFGGTVMDRVYNEGLHFILPWDMMYTYNTRIQEESLRVDVLTRDGLTIDTDVSIRFHIDASRLPFLHRFVGQDYRQKMIIPVLTSSVRQTVGSYRPFELYDVARDKIQHEIIVEAIEEINRVPLVVDRIIVKRIHLPRAINAAIEDKLVAEQRYLRYEYLIKEAREEYKRKYIEASTVRMFQNMVNAGLTTPFLRYQGIQATRDLAASSNAKVVVVGGGDGLPLILNLPGEQAADKAAPVSPPPPANATSAVPAAPSPQPLPQPAPHAAQQGADMLDDALRAMGALARNHDQAALPEDDLKKAFDEINRQMPTFQGGNSTPGGPKP